MIVPMGIDPGSFIHTMPPIPRNFDNINGAQILFVGQLKDYKGVDILDAMRILTVEKKLNTNLPIIEWTGPPALVGRAERLGLQKFVTFEGTVDDETLVKSYSTSDLIVLPSLFAREVKSISNILRSNSDSF